MPKPIPDSHLDLFQKKAFCYLGTAMKDGTPQVSTVWVDYDGEYILINTAAGRVKDKNMRERPMVGMTIQDPENPYRNLMVQGKVVEVIEEADGARDHINKMSLKYRGKPVYDGPASESRRLFKISPEKVLAH